MAVVVNSQKVYCEWHQLEIDFLCGECRVLLCRSCVGPHLSDRQFHPLKPLQEALSDTQNSIRTIRSKLSQICEAAQRERLLQAEQQQREQKQSDGEGDGSGEKKVSQSVESLFAVQRRAEEVLCSAETVCCCRLLQTLDFSSGRRATLRRRRLANRLTTQRAPTGQKTLSGQETETESWQNIATALGTLQNLETTVSEFEGLQPHRKSTVPMDSLENQAFLESILKEFLQKLVRNLEILSDWSTQSHQQSKGSYSLANLLLSF